LELEKGGVDRECGKEFKGGPERGRGGGGSYIVRGGPERAWRRGRGRVNLGEGRNGEGMAAEVVLRGAGGRAEAVGREFLYLSVFYARRLPILP